jgi:hypothetical protein
MDGVTYLAAARSISQHVPSLLLKYDPHRSFLNLSEDTERSSDRCGSLQVEFADRIQVQLCYSGTHVTEFKLLL